MKLDLDVLTPGEQETLSRVVKLSTDLIGVCTRFVEDSMSGDDLYDWPVQARHVLMRAVPPEDHSAATEDRVRAMGMALLLLESVLNLDRHDPPNLRVVEDG